MDTRPHTDRLQRRSFPVIGKFGIATIGFGLLLDLVEHTLVFQASEATSRGFGAGEHAAHLVVLVGMVLVLVSVIADGVHASGRDIRPEWSPRDAVR